MIVFSFVEDHLFTLENGIEIVSELQFGITPGAFLSTHTFSRIN